MSTPVKYRYRLWKVIPDRSVLGGACTTNARNSSDLRTLLDSGAVPDGSTTSTREVRHYAHPARTRTEKRHGSLCWDTGDARECC